MTNLDITSAYVGTTQVLYMYMGDELVWPSTPPTPTPYDEQYFTVEVVSAGTIGWKAGTAATPATIYYSINDGEWTSLTSSTAGTSFNVNAGDKVRFKGNNATYCGVSASTYMNSFQGTTAYVNVYGNIMSLTDGDNFVSAKTFSSPYVFRGLLSFSKLLDAENLILPATALTEGCYFGMLGGTSITTAPALPATTLAKNSYMNMFLNASSLVNAPDILPATTLAESCYNAMFYGTRLTKGPELPATTLATSCYHNMFGNCTGLTQAPELSATTLAERCYFQMFKNCSNINYIKCLATDISAAGSTSNWVNGVASAGTFVKSAEMSGWTTGVNGIPTGWIVQDDVLPYEEQYLTFEILSAGTINWKTDNSPKTIEYSKDNGSTWTSITSSTAGTSFNVSAGDKVLFRGNNDTYAVSTSGNHFQGSTAIFNLYGNIMSLIYGDNFIGQTTLASSYTFVQMFRETKVIDASNLVLPATTLTSLCYYQMFHSCTGLTQAPELPATTLASGCYEGMFYSCTTLTTAPELLVETLVQSCYHLMFYGCTSLNYIKCLATDRSPYDCTSTWVEGVASTGTFVKAASMSSWPTGKNGIPSGWTVIDDNPSYKEQYLTFEILSAGTINWVGKMGHSKTIEYSKDNGSTWTSITSSQAGTSFNVSAGDKVMFKGDNDTYFSSTTRYSLFSGSTAIFNAYGNIMSLIDSTNFSVLTSFTGNHNFYHLFSDTKIVDARNLILPVKTLTDYCYAYMFKNCSRLIGITCLATSISATGCTNSWMDGVASAGTFVKAAGMTGWTTGTSGIPTGWTVQDAS